MIGKDKNLPNHYNFSSIFWLRWYLYDDVGIFIIRGCLEAVNYTRLKLKTKPHTCAPFSLSIIPPKNLFYTTDMKLEIHSKHLWECRPTIILKIFIIIVWTNWEQKLILFSCNTGFWSVKTAMSHRYTVTTKCYELDKGSR